MRDYKPRELKENLALAALELAILGILIALTIFTF